MNILCIFLVCSIIVEICFAQGSINQVEMSVYLRTMTYAVWDKIRAYGLSNLPDHDISIPYSIADGNSYDIKGTLYLEDGFVMDIYGISLGEQDKTKSTIGEYYSSIDTVIAFNILFYRDFRFEAEEPEKIPDRTIGGVIITPESMYFDVTIMQYLKDYTVNCTMSSVFQGKAYKRSLDFHPKNVLTDRLKKALPPGTPMFEKIGESWKPIFEPILNEIVKIMPFPAVEFLV